MTTTKQLFQSRSRTPGTFNRRRTMVLVLGLVCVSTSASAQQYKSDPVDETAVRNSAVAQQCLKNPTFYAANKEKFDAFFNSFYFPTMTSADDDKLGHLGLFRLNLFKLYLWNTGNVQLQQDLTTMAYDYMKNVVLDPSYHPAVRYNAILVIGMLDEQYSDGRQPPKPLQRATKAITGVVDLATTDKNKLFPPSLILGALVGLERHAQFHASLPPEAVTAMTAALVKLATHEEPILGLNRDTYAWMRMRAASALSKLGTTGDKNVVHNALITLISTSKSLDDRCEVAGLLDKITNYKDVKLDDAGTAEPLFALARDLAVAEDKRAQDYQDQSVGGALAGRTPDLGLSGTGSEQEIYPRRQILARLTGLYNGVAKVQPALPAETQKKAKALLDAIDPAKKAAASKDVVEPKVAEAVRVMAAAINKAVPPPEKPGVAKAADVLEQPQRK